MLDDIDLLVAGAGPAGCTVAERAATVLGWKVLVIDRREHLAGNCHDSRHTNGVLVHNYGPHYFRTSDESLLAYLSKFTDYWPPPYSAPPNPSASVAAGRSGFMPRSSSHSAISSSSK